MIKTSLAAALAATSLLVPVAQAKESIVILSPFAAAESKDAQIREIGGYLAETTLAGETSYVLDGWSQDVVASFTVPDDAERYARPASRMRANAAFFKAIKGFADAPQPTVADQHDGQINWPAVLRRVGGDFATEAERDLIFYEVSPIYHDARMPAFSMRDGVLFSDAHLEVSRNVSPFGAARQAGLLKAYVVHWAFGDTDWQVSDRHAYHAERMMALSVGVRSGVLATFAADGATALANAKASKTTPSGAFALDSDGRPAMVTFRPTAPAAQVDAAQDLPIYGRALSDRVPERADLAEARDVEIAIRWTCACDFDLAVKPRNGQAISFRNSQTTQGTLFKDFTSASSLSNGWETIALPGPLDLTQAVIAINLYAGQGGRVELRISIEGETWAKIVPITEANSGFGFARTLETGQPDNPSWRVLPAEDVMGLDQ